MNKRDIIMQTIRHQGGNVVPFCIRLTDEAHELYDDALLRDYRNTEVMDDFRAGKLSKQEAVSLSIGNFMFEAPFPWWSWDYEKLPAVYHDPYETPDMMPPTTDADEAAFGASFEKTRYIREKYGVYMSALVWGSHWEKAYFTRGIEAMLADFAAAPEFVGELLTFIIHKNMEYLNRILQCPDYDGILLGSDWGTQRDMMFSPTSWRKLIAPGELTEYDAIHAAGKDVMVHSCGCILKIMQDLCDMGVDILNPVQPECMDLAFLKQNYGHRITFWGGISTQRVLPGGTPSEVAAETERVIRLLSQNGGYITCSSQEIQTDVPYENLRALIDTAREFAGL